MWQISAGDSGRDYSDVFLRFGLMAVGPGQLGPYETDDEYRDRSSWAWRDWMRDFCVGVGDRDYVILKQPYRRRAWRIAAVGQVHGDYQWREQLADVEGWDLQHTHDVSWRRPTEDPIINTGFVRRTIAKVGAGEVERRALELWETGAPLSPDPLPAPAEKVELDDLIDGLIDQGLPVSRAEEVVATLSRVTRLARWYDQHSSNVGEHEIRTFLIVPLLLALGWGEQQIKIEYQRVDVALFAGPYADGAQPTTVIESKRLHDGLSDAVAEQAKGYAAGFGSCERLLVSDGVRYKLSERAADGSWPDKAYGNLLNLLARHPLDGNIKGAPELFYALLPQRLSLRMAR
jgi:hypothetical protein